MKIASRIKPRSGKPRIVTIHGRPYAFAPTEDKHGEQHFVAEVHNETHAEVLLGSGDFYHYDENLVPQPTTVPPQAAGAGDAAPPPPSIDFPAEVKEEATTLLAGSVASISTAVGKVSGLAVVQAALAIEKASDGKRKTVLALLQSVLDGAAAAGVKA